MVPAKKSYRVNLPQHLADCEANYCRLQCLLQDAEALVVGEFRQYSVGNCSDSESVLRFVVVEQTRYTTLIRMVQFYAVGVASCGANTAVGGNTADSAKKFRESNKTRSTYQGDIRLYHDANVAEFTKCQNYQQFKPRYEYPNTDMHQINEKAQMNRFLGELLTHYLSHGRVHHNIVDHFLIG